MLPNLNGLHFLLTGGTGYLGRQVVKELVSRGAYVTLLTTSSIELVHPRLQAIKWSLHSADFESSFLTKSSCFPRPTSLIHLAYSWRNAVDQHGISINVSGTLNLYRWAKENGIKFVFVSSVSAREGALNRYGREKFFIERSLSQPEAVVAKVGLVYGGDRLSQWGQLLRIVAVSRVLPMIDPWVMVQPISIEKTVSGLICLSTQNGFSRASYVIAGDIDLCFGDFLKIVSYMFFNRELFVISIPHQMVLYPLMLIGLIIPSANIIRDRVLGIVGMTKIYSTLDLQELDLLNDDLISAYKRKRIFYEAVLFISAVTGSKPTASSFSVETYVRAIIAQRGGVPYSLPFWVFHPIFLRCIEPLPFVTRRHPAADELTIRLNLALGIVETGELATYVYPYEKTGIDGIKILLIFLSEALIFPFRLLYWKLRR